jgi:phage tail-like protein
MARSSISDYLQVYPFWIMDVAPIEPLALPIFTPLMGFSAITAPEMTIEVQEIDEANWLYSRKVAKRATTNDITLTRAAKWFDSDFYKWIMATLTGDTGGRGSRNSLAIGGATPRRTLLLVNFLSHSPLPSGGAAEAVSAAGLLALQGTVTGMIGGGQSLGPGFIGGALATGAAAAGTALGTSFGPSEFAPRIPAKAWVLYDCIPTRYKTGGDFDAMSSDVSLQELDIAVEYWDELSLGSDLAPVVAITESIAGAVVARVNPTP